LDVNVSAQTLGDLSLTRTLARALRSVQVDAENLVFEITETAAVENIDVAIAFSRRLERLGCSLALDDFGTGFGSFSYLKALTVRYLKLDRSYVTNLADDSTDRGVVRSIVGLARHLGQLTIAEGVESATAMDVLRAEGVDYAQGYFVGRPGPVELALAH
jgi:EAL domain-containing protein (putative c-di-GMP-specific phosphodiesterase class I)